MENGELKAIDSGKWTIDSGELKQLKIEGNCQFKKLSIINYELSI